MVPAFKKKVTSLVVAISLFFPILTPFSARTAFAHPAGPGKFPMGHIVHFGALLFLFLDGIFFRPGPRGYVVVPAPVGAVVPVLPSSAVLVTVEGVPQLRLLRCVLSANPGRLCGCDAAGSES